MASQNQITVGVFSIFAMAILFSSGAPVTPTDPPVMVCQPWLLCGSVAYNPQEKQCCEDGSVQSLPRSCGPELTFDPCSQRCCPDSVQRKFTVVEKTQEGIERTGCETSS